jgi:hypothetical protein
MIHLVLRSCSAAEKPVGNGHFSAFSEILQPLENQGVQEHFIISLFAFLTYVNAFPYDRYIDLPYNNRQVLFQNIFLKKYMGE